MRWPDSRQRGERAKHNGRKRQCSVIDALYQAVSRAISPRSTRTPMTLYGTNRPHERSACTAQQAILEHAIQLAVLADGTIATRSRDSAGGIMSPS